MAPGRVLEFPKDLGAHPDFRVEWWYLTANLEDQSGAVYGVQWTLFRQALEPGPQRPGWANQTIWMGHAALTAAEQHLYAETFARGGIGQAGVTANPFHAWIDAWSIRSTASDPHSGLQRLEVTASGKGFSYRLQLKTDKPLILHGDQGYSVKSNRGQASYYFSQPSFEIEGVITLGSPERRKVSGSAWMDREWSSQPLAPDQKGWDWFSLHLDGGEKLMLFKLRHDDGTSFGAGTWIGADGTAQSLPRDDMTIEPLDHYVIAGRRLPTRWALKIKSRGLHVETRPLNKGSWMGTSFPYWEGPIGVSGSHSGRGYLEMTGY